MNKIEKAKRLAQLPPYLFAELDKVKNDLRRKGRDIIDLGIGDPDLPSPPSVITKLYEAAKNPENHHYPPYEGLLSFRRAVSEWYGRRFGVELDPEGEVLALIGSKEGIAHISLSLVDPGDFVLVPDPAYPVYRAGVIFAGGVPCPMPILEKDRFLPSLNEIDENVAKKARVLFINYPNNPTGATATKDFFQRVVDFAREFDIVICHDLAYSEVFFDECRPCSFLQVKGAKEVGVEFHSLSKTFNMTGWRIGFVVGNEKVIQALREVKTNVDSGVFQAIQEAGIEALKLSDEFPQRIRKVYQRRRDILVEGLREMGWPVDSPEATFYLWVKVSCPSIEFSRTLLEECGVVVTPGVGFGPYGEGYVRIALTVDEEEIREAMRRIKESNFMRREILRCRA